MADQTIYELIEHDHREVEGLFQRMKDESGHPAMATFEKLRTELLRHMEAEEKAFYGALEGKQETKQLVLDGRKEHYAARELMSVAAGSPGTPGGGVFVQKAQELEQAIQHHVQEEEGQLFPRARKVVTQEQAVEIGAAFREAKRAWKG